MHIDLWTLFFQTLNVLVLIWLLQKFLYKPVIAIITRRQAEAVAVLSKAEEAHGAAEAIKHSWQERRDALTQEGEQILVQARNAAKTARATLLAQAADEAATRRVSADASIQHEREMMKSDLAEQAVELAVTISSKLASRVPTEAVSMLLFDGLIEKLNEFTVNERQQLARSEAVTLLSAGPISDAEQDRWRARLRDVIGNDRVIRIAADPYLIAGVELQSATLVVRNNWRADLDQLKAELNRKDKDVGSAAMA